MALGYRADTRRNQRFILALVIVGLAIPMAAQATTVTSADRHRRIVLVSIADRKLAVSMATKLSRHFQLRWAPRKVQVPPVYSRSSAEFPIRRTTAPA